MEQREKHRRKAVGKEREREREIDREREIERGHCVSDKTPQAALMKSLSWRWRDCLWNGLLIGEAAAWCSVRTN